MIKFRVTTRTWVTSVAVGWWTLSSLKMMWLLLWLIDRDSPNDLWNVENVGDKKNPQLINQPGFSHSLRNHHAVYMMPGRSGLFTTLVSSRGRWPKKWAVAVAKKWVFYLVITPQKLGYNPCDILWLCSSAFNQNYDFLLLVFCESCSEHLRWILRCWSLTVKGCALWARDVHSRIKKNACFIAIGIFSAYRN